MAILKKVYLIVIPALMTGCYEDFIPEIDIKPVLCLNSLITAGEPIEVSVTRTWLFTDEGGAMNHQVEDAVVSVYVDGDLKGSDYIPREGDRIKIVADSRAFGSAEAEVVVPKSVPIESLTWEADVTDSWRLDHQEMTSLMYRINLRAKMTVADPADIENYYQFSYTGFPEDVSGSPGVTIYQSVKFYAGTFLYEAEPIFSEHIGVLDAISGNDSYGFTFFTDRQFQGDSYTLTLQFNDMSFEVRNVELTEDMLNCGLEMQLSSLSSSYYNMCNYQWHVENGTIGEFGDIGLGDPVMGYSNVSTGAGVVAARSVATYTVNLRNCLKFISLCF